MAKLAIEGAMNTRAQIESELAEEARQRAELECGAAQEASAAAGEARKKRKKRTAIWQMKNLPWSSSLGL